MGNFLAEMSACNLDLTHILFSALRVVPTLINKDLKPYEERDRNLDTTIF